MRFLALLFFLMPLVTNAQLWSEDFDGSNTTNPASWSSPSLPCGDNNDYVGIVCTPGTGCPIEVSPGANPGFEYFGATGQFFGARDMDSTPCGSGVSLDETLTFSGIDISSSPVTTTLYVCFDVAESRNNDPNGDGDFSDGAEWGTSNMREDTWDGNSFLFVNASVDGSPFDRVTAVSNFAVGGSTSDRRPGIDINCNGQSNDAGEPELTATFTSYCFELPTSGSSLDLNFNVGGLNGGGEDIAIDNIEIHSGSTPAGGTLLPACTPFVPADLSCNDLVLWRENFDGSNTTNPPGIILCDPTPSRDYLGIVCNNGDGCQNEINDDYLYFGASGQFFGVRDMDNVCNGSLDETLSFTGIDISACTGTTNLMYLCLDLAESQPNEGREMTGTPPREDSWDGSSSVNFMVNIDDCGFQEVSAIESIDGTDSRPAIDVDCNGGSATSDHLLSDTFQTFCFELTSLGSTLDLDINILGLNTDGEDIAIDNIEVICADDPTCLPSLPIVSCSLAEPLVIECPADVNIDCAASTDPASTGMATTESCPAEVSFADASTQGMGCALGNYTITRTWTVTAPSGATETCVQTINVTDTTPPVAACNNIAIVTDMTGSYTLTPADIAAIAAGTTDDCSGLDMSSVTPNVFTNADVGDNTVTLTVTDACGNASTCMATVNVTRGCTLDIDCSLVVDQTLECSADLPAEDITLVTAFDSCGPITVTAATVVSANAGCPGDAILITRTYSVVDTENNMAECIQTFTVESMVAPTIACPADVTVQCDQGTTPADTGMATGTASCSAAVITFADASTQTATGCGANTFVITRTWTATDDCGRIVTCDQIINVEDTTPPVIACPADINGTCTDSTLPADTGMATATDNCSADIIITSSDVSTQTLDGCGQFTFVITRTWTATDACGNASTCDQILSIADIEGPTITCPPNQMLTCRESPRPLASDINEFIAIGGLAADNCSNVEDLTLSFFDIPAAPSMLDFCPGSSEADRTLTRTYTITDVCGNVSSCDQLFIYAESLNGPVITATPADQTVDCPENAFPNLALFSADGECSDITFSVSDAVSSGTAGCPGSTIQYTYTATDACGRFATHVQTFTLANEGPEFVCPSDICVIDCSADTDMIQANFDAYAELATVISSCSSNITIGNSFNANSFITQNCANPTVAVEGAVAYQVVTFTATDACGRNGSCTALVVLKDSDGPVIESGVSVGIADCNDTNLQQGYTAWATNQINGLSASDGCASGSVSFSFTPSSPNTDCSSGLASTAVSFIATDACGNETILNTFYRIIDNGNGEPVMATVSGNLMTEEDEMVSLATVEVEGFLNNQMTTTDDGYYLFDLMMAQNYAITPSRNDDPLNGITTYDLILLGQHVLETNLLDSPYKMIAADVNESGSITALDMIQLRRLILHIDDEFSSGKSWTFVDAAYTFPNPSNPFATTYPTTASINNLTTSETINFVGVKLGDLNASAATNALQAGDTRSSDGTLEIKMEDEMLRAGQTYQLAFNASDFKEVAGFQFTLDFATESLEVLDYETSALSNMSANNFGFTKANEGKITVSWNETNAVSMADDATLFEISFTALADVQLSEVLAINSSVTASEAYQADLRKDVVLNFGNAISADNGFTLLQNQPNPFNQETIIGFQLPERTTATLTVYDISGRVILTQENSYDAGVHQVVLNSADLGTTGVLYYQLSTPVNTDTKKMIILK